MKVEYFIEREFTNEISPVEAIFPIVMEYLKSEQQLYFDNKEEFFKRHPDLKYKEKNVEN